MFHCAEYGCWVLGRCYSVAWRLQFPIGSVAQSLVYLVISHNMSVSAIWEYLPEMTRGVGGPVIIGRWFECKQLLWWRWINCKGWEVASLDFFAGILLLFYPMCEDARTIAEPYLSAYLLASPTQPKKSHPKAAVS